LSQHTADANSLPAFFRLKETFSTWNDVARAGPDQVAQVIRQAGLANQKAKSIVAALIEIERRNGAMNIDGLSKLEMKLARAWLETLPGVGPKTASIVLCFSFGMEAIPVDTHVYRVSKRLNLIPHGMTVNAAHDALLAIVPKGLAYRFHMSLIQHGRAVCRAPIPKCEACILVSRCPHTQSVTKTKGRLSKVSNLAKKP
jgi:endonuclease-3